MADKPSLADLHEQHTALLSDAEKLIEEAGNDPTDEQMAQLREAKEKAQTLRASIDKEEEKQGVIDGLKAAADENGKVQAARSKPVVPAIYGGNGQKENTLRSPGEMFTESDVFKGWLSQFPQGGPPEGSGLVRSQALQIPGAARMMGFGQYSMRALVTAGDASAGDLVRPDYRGLLAPGLVRPLRLRQLVSVIPVQTDAVEYAKENTRTYAAAPVAEATALTGTSGTKPEAGIDFDLVTETVKTFAVWVAATKRILSDATGLRAYIDQFLFDDLGILLENQMLAGSGAGENFRGILNSTPAIGDVGAIPAGGSVLDSIREAVTYVELNGRTSPTGIVLHPSDAEKIDLLKINSEVNHFVGMGPFAGTQYPNIWGMARVVSEAITAGTFLVGDFRRAILFDREDMSIQVGTAGDDFIRNLMRILAEMRAAFGVIRPGAFCKGAVP